MVNEFHVFPHAGWMDSLTGIDLLIPWWWRVISWGMDEEGLRKDKIYRHPC